MRRALGSVTALVVFLSISSAHAVTRQKVNQPFWHRLVVSAYGGYPVPVGDFDTLGEHTTPEIGSVQDDFNKLDLSAQVEFYFAPNVSLGLMATQAEFDDKSLGDSLQTEIGTLGGFVKFTYVTQTSIHPFISFGVSGMKVTFDNKLADARDEADWATSMNIDGGFYLRLLPNVAVDGMVRYMYGFTTDKLVNVGGTDPAVVGFDVQTVSFNVGVSLIL